MKAPRVYPPNGGGQANIFFNKKAKLRKRNFIIQYVR
jgi:hypothetical protein